jgi:hypothetical protein
MDHHSFSTERQRVARAVIIADNVIEKHEHKGDFKEA